MRNRDVASLTLNDLIQSLFSKSGYFQRPLFNSKYWSIVWCPTLAWKLELETVDEYTISNTIFKYWWILQDTLLFILHRPYNLCVFERRLPFRIWTTRTWKNIPTCWSGYIDYKIINRPAVCVFSCLFSNLPLQGMLLISNLPQGQMNILSFISKQLKYF